MKGLKQEQEAKAVRSQKSCLHKGKKEKKQMAENPKT